MTVGASYERSFKMAAESDLSQSQSITVDFPSGSSTGSETFSANTPLQNYWTDWESKSMEFIATNISVELRFTANGQYDVGLDSVIVTLTTFQPFVSISNPTNGATFATGTNITIEADASESGGTITQVAFFADGTQIGTAKTAPYSSMWTNLPTGQHSLTATASVAVGATVTSAPVVINVIAPDPGPTVAITVPTDGTSFFAGMNLTVSADATDPAGSIAFVRFYADDGTTVRVVGTITDAPYTIVWTNVAAGNYSLTARAVDNAGLLGISAPVNVSVNGTQIPCSAIAFSENFESGQLAAGVTVSTVGTFNSPPGIQPLTNFGGSKAFGFGLSTCPENCFDGEVTTLTITLPAPTYISELSFEEMELFSNWGSEGLVHVDGVQLNQPDGSGDEDFGRVPVNDYTADTTFRTHQFVIDQVVTTVALSVVDITDLSEIYVDDITLTTISSNSPAIVAQPQSLTVAAASTAVFTVSGSSLTTISYQWSFNKTNIVGATNASFSIPNVGPAQAGNYQVVLVNCSGWTNSQIATLAVTNSSPTLTVYINSASRAYGVPNPIFTGMISNLQSGDDITATYISAATVTSNVGPYAIVPVFDDPGHKLSNYFVATNGGTLTITQAVPVLTWISPAETVYGNPLTGSQLDAAANVPGTNSYLPPLGTVLMASSGQTLSVKFTPNDTTNYTTAAAAVHINVQRASLTNSADNKAVAFGAPLPTLTSGYQGFVNRDTPASLTTPVSLGTTASNGSPAGMYPITNCCATSPNYDISFVSGTLTITNVAAVPTLTIDDAMVTAPASGTTNIVFTVTLSAPGTQPVSVNFATADGTARAGVDYVATNGMLTFPPGITNQFIPVSVIGHTTTNPADVYFSVNLSGATGATLGRSQAVGTIHETPPPLPSVFLVTPTDQSSYCLGTAIPLLASVSNSASPPTNVAFYYQLTNTLGAVASPPYSFSWSPTGPGDYSLTAVASFSDGSTLASAQALVAVTTTCGQVAIVRSEADPEIALLQTNLFQLGLGSQVFDQAGLNFAILTNFELVIWDGLNGHITDNTVSVLYSIFSNGIPLYLIGDNLASDTPQLDEPAYANWVLLTSLTPADGKAGDGSVEVSSQLIMDPILNGRFGTVSNFVYSNAVDSATLTNAGASILGQSGAAVVLVKYPGDSTDIGQTRIVTQNFQVASGADQNSLVQRQTLFLNSVWWLAGIPRLRPGLSEPDGKRPAQSGGGGATFDHTMGGGQQRRMRRHRGRSDLPAARRRAVCQRIFRRWPVAIRRQPGGGDIPHGGAAQPNDRNGQPDLPAPASRDNH